MKFTQKSNAKVLKKMLMNMSTQKITMSVSTETETAPCSKILMDMNTEVIGDSEVKSVFIPIPKVPFYREILIKGKWETDDDAILDIYDAFNNHLEISTKSPILSDKLFLL